jgi:hypothetical protein
MFLPKICNKKAFRFGANFSDVKKLLLAEGFLHVALVCHSERSEESL